MRVDAALSHMLQYTCRWDALDEVRSRVSRDLNRMLALAGSSSAAAVARARVMLPPV